MTQSSGVPTMRSGRYLPGLDGIRALAVLAVILFHSYLGIAPAGFLGVEVFFVISGFIITLGLVREWRRDGGIRFSLFWLRRARRLLPALFLLLLVVVAWADLFLRDEIADLRRDALAALGYFTNWYLIFSGEDYFDTFTRPSLLRHLWSLAIEEQFYLAWPLLTFVGLRLLRPRGYAVIIFAGGIASALWMALLFNPATDVSRVYFGTDTRLSGLFLGAALALIWSPSENPVAGPWRRGALEFSAFAALSLLGTAMLVLNETHSALYRGGFLVVDAATLLLIVPAVSPGTWAWRYLGCRPLRWLGLRSYGIYLWHWPVMVLSRPGEDVALDGLPLFALQLAVTLVLSAASYRWLELPVREGALGRFRSRFATWWGVRPWRVAGTMLGAPAALAVVAAVGAVAAVAQAPEEPDYFKLESVRIINEATAKDDIPSASRAPDDLPGSHLGVVFAAGIARSTVLVGRTEELLLSPTPPGATVLLSPLGSLAQGVVPEFPSRPPEPPEPLRVTAIGDSVMLGAARQLAADAAADDFTIDVDAAVSRAMVSALGLLSQREAGGELGNVLLIHMGNNGPIDDEQVEQVFEIAGADRRVVFLNLRVPRYWEEPNNEVLARVVPEHANAVLIDWHAATEPHPELFWRDGIHLRPEGAVFYSDLIRPQLTAP